MQVQTNTYDLKAGMQLISCGIKYNIISIHEDSVRLECDEDNRYNKKQRHSVSIAQLNKVLADKFYQIVK